MILKKWILGPERAGLNNKQETGPRDSMLAARYLGFWGLGLGDFGIRCSLRVVNVAISLETFLLSHSTCLCFSISTLYSFPLNLILEDLTLCFFCVSHF